MRVFRAHLAAGVCVAMLALTPGATSHADAPRSYDVPQSAGAWGTVEAVSPGGTHAYRPEVVVDTAGRATVVWAQDGFAWAAGRPADGVWEEPRRLGRGGFPVVDADDAGRVTVAWRGPRDSILASRRVPGQGWSEPVTLSPRIPKDSDRVAWPPDIDVGAGGTVAVVTTFGVWQERGWQVRVAHRSPGGRWRVSDVGGFGRHVGDPHVAVDAEGNVDLVYTRRGVVTVRKPAGHGWGRPVRLTRERYGPQSIAIGPDGRAVIAWYQRVPGEGWASYVSTRETDGWASPERISAEGTSVVVAGLAVDGTGRATVATIRRHRHLEVVDRPAEGTWGSPAPVWRWKQGRLWQRPDLAVNESGQGLMAWIRMVEVGDDEWDLFAEATYRSGDSWAPAERLTPDGAGRPGVVATAVAPDGSGLLVWEHWVEDESSTQILARWFRPAP